MSSKRIIYERAKIGVLTQGSIINGCIAEDFPDEEVYGCVVTPRCALGHDGKVTTVHYVPVVRFDRWFDIVGKPKVKELWKKELRGQINNVFKNENIAENIMDANLSLGDMLKLTQNVKEKNRVKLVNNINAYYDVDSTCFDIFLKEGRGCLTSYLKELKENKNSSYYLIESWEESKKNDFFVIMLRDVRRLQKHIASQFRNGVPESEIAPIDLYHNDLFTTTQKEHFYWVEAQLASPFIEHVLQAFVHNFSQIGVEDISGDTTDKLISKIKGN